MHQRPTIFLAEDSPADCYLFQEALKAHHVETELFIFHDGEDAMAFLTSAEENGPQPQLFVIDLNLPKVDGFQLVNEIKMIDPTLRVILMSAYCISESDIMDNLNPGVRIDKFITKPISLNNLIDIIQSIT